MRFTNIAVISMMSLLMVACGGGGGSDSSGGSSSSSSTPEATAEVEPVAEVPVEIPAVEVVVADPEVNDVVEPDPEAVYATTAELVAAKSFLFEPSYELAVSLSNNDKRSIYLSVCSDFIEDDSGISVNYNSCLLRTSIESDYSGTLSVANDKDRLVMAIWYLDDIDNPRYETWENSDDTEADKLFEVNE